MRCDADAVHASKSTLNKMPRRRLLAGGVATALITIASALQPALRVRTPALARVTRPPVASAYTVLRAAENDDDTVAVEDEEAASDEADEAVAEEETTEEEEEEEAEEVMVEEEELASSTSSSYSSSESTSSSSSSYAWRLLLPSPDGPFVV